MNVVVFSTEEWGKPLPGDDERAVHVREILRLEPGDVLKIGLLEKGLGSATVEKNDKGGLVLSFPSTDTLTTAPKALPIHVLLGHPRPPVMQRLLKDLNSMSIQSLSICVSELSEKSYFQSRLWSKGLWESFLVQGAQQGGHVHRMTVKKYWSVKKALEDLEMPAQSESTAAYHDTLEGTQKLVLDLDAGDSLLSWTASFEPRAGQSIYAAIGPERGWTDAERELFAARGFLRLGLGSRVLRTETAAILACGILSLALQEHGF